MASAVIMPDLGMYLLEWKELALFHKHSRYRDKPCDHPAECRRAGHTGPILRTDIPMVGSSVQTRTRSTNVTRPRRHEYMLARDIETLRLRIKRIVQGVSWSARELWKGDESRDSYVWSVSARHGSNACQQTLTLCQFPLLDHLGNVRERCHSIEEEGCGKK